MKSEKNHEKKVDERSTAVTPVIDIPWKSLGDVCFSVFGLLFLFQCMILPLVGKAAMTGSGSPDAGRAEWAIRNTQFFGIMLCVTLLFGLATLAIKWLPYRNGDGRFPRATVTLLIITVGMGLALKLGLLHI